MKRNDHFLADDPNQPAPAMTFEQAERFNQLVFSHMLTAKPTSTVVTLEPIGLTGPLGRFPDWKSNPPPYLYPPENPQNPNSTPA